MERSQIASPETDIRFLLSLLRISSPGEPASEQSQSLSELLLAEATR